MAPTQRKPTTRKRPAPAKQTAPVKPETQVKQTGLGKRLRKAAAEARAIAHGAAAAPRVYVPPDVDVKAIRTRLRMTQQKFANTFGFPLATLRDWEQGRDRPDASTRAYLTVIAREAKTA
jgi:putative transcriptional regulator